MPSINPWYRSLALTLCCLVVNGACPVSWAQQTPGASPHLVITILDGEGALNDIRQRTAREPIIEVQDENHKPVAGAAVLFLLPGSGPSGGFADGSQIFSTVTDAAGRAAAPGLQPNSISGSYEIHVKVTYNGSTAETTIHQKNVSSESEQQPSQNTSAASTVAAPVARGLSMKSILIIVGAAAAAGVVAGVLATRGGNSTDIAAGPPTVGAPTTAGVRISLHLHRR
ncbi:MAG: carboxypeptidase-like regulatory domain-containing protein [Silvibacterium sp.]